MAVINALQRVPGALARNPIIVVVFGLFGLLQAPQLLAQAVSPLLAGVLSLVLVVVFVFVVPFVQGGLTKMADDALDGRTSLDSFVAAGKENYVSLLGAYLVVFGVSFALGAIGFGVLIFGGVFAIASGDGFATTGFAVVAVIAAVLGLAYFAFAFFVQFYMQEVVLGGASALGSLKRSAGLVRRNLLSTLGYFVVVLVGSSVFGGVIGGLSVVFMPSGTNPAATPSLSSTVLYVVVLTIGTAIIGSIMLTYAVSFWREIRGENALA